MRKRGIYTILIALLFTSCGVNNRKEIESIIGTFKNEKISDLRETVFDVRAEFAGGQVVLKGETDNKKLKEEFLSKLSSFKFREEIILLPDSTVGDKRFGLINLSVANLRSKPAYSAELATQGLLGMPVKILKKEDGWAKVQTPDNYISWIEQSALTNVTEDGLKIWRNTKRILFSGDNGLIFETEKFEKPVSDVSMGNILEETERSWSFIKVKFPDGRVGYTPPANWSDFNDFKNSVKADTLKLKQLALQLMGRPYLWGGTSARAMDCSGFVKTIYFMNGIILGRDASLQVMHGELVNTVDNFDKVEPGDLLFFGRRATNQQTERVSHVALSLGTTEYIHASGRVKINSFNTESSIYEEYRNNTFIRVRRIIGSEGTEGIQTVNNHPWY